MVDELSAEAYKARAGSPTGLTFNEDIMFANHAGVHKPRIEKKQRKLAGKVGFLGSFLEEGEQLLCITSAVSPTPLMEQLTTGFIFVYVKRCLLVFTDRRMFHIPTTMDYDYRGSVAEVRYGDVASMRQKGARLNVEFKDGSKELFLYIRRAERKKIRALLEKIDWVNAVPGSGRRAHLCPQCTSGLERDRYECPSCGKAFKDRTRARNLSIWLPGGGYFYTRHPFLGVGDAAVELVFIVLILFALMPGPGQVQGDYVTAGFLALLLFVEKAITVYHANHFTKEYIPTEAVAVSRGPMRMVMNAVAGVFVVLFAGLVVFSLWLDLGEGPSARVLSTQELSAEQVHDLVDAQIVGADETVELFYSEGVFSVLEGGSVLTNRRVIVYSMLDDGQVEYFWIPNNEITSVVQVEEGNAFDYSVYQVNGLTEDQWMYLFLPYEMGDGERFANAVRAKIGNR